MSMTAKGGWAKFKTKEARKKEFARRRKLWSAAAKKKAHPGGKPKKKPSKFQKIYAERYAAKQRGETPPPLPGEQAA